MAGTIRTVVGEKDIHRYLTKAQEETFKNLSPNFQRYILFRVQGAKKTEAVKMAGYNSSDYSKIAYTIEKRHPEIVTLIQAVEKQKVVETLNDPESKLNTQIDALANQYSADTTLEVLKHADAETYRRIKFYRDIMQGKIVSTKRVVKKDDKGKVLEVREEEMNDVEMKMRARKELDRIFGLTQMGEMGQVRMGDITINIVDASKQNELAAPENQIVLNEQNVEVVDSKTQPLKEGGEDGA